MHCVVMCLLRLTYYEVIAAMIVKCETPRYVQLYVRIGKGGNLVKVGEFRDKSDAVACKRKLEAMYALEYVIQQAKRNRGRGASLDSGLTAR